MRDFWGLPQRGGQRSERVVSELSMLFSLSAKHANPQAIVFEIPETVRPALNQFHFAVEILRVPGLLHKLEDPDGFFLYSAATRFFQSG